MAFAKAWEGHGRERKPTEGPRVGAAGGDITDAPVKAQAAAGRFGSIRPTSQAKLPYCR